MIPRWIKGRQGGDYYKMPLLISKRFRFDIYLLKFPKGAYVPMHYDKVQGGRHWRLNLTLVRPRKGGKVRLWDGPPPVINTKRIMLFRPDICRHMLEQVVEGRLIMLSIGRVISGGA